MGSTSSGLLPKVNARATSTARSIEAEVAAVAAGSRSVEQLLESLVASWHLSPAILQKRRWHRVVHRNRMVLVPLDESTWSQAGEPRLVDGRDLSLGGISFHHVASLPHRVVAITLHPDDWNAPWIAVCLTWCRFSLDHTYLSGGRFLRTLPPPVSSRAWQNLPRA